MAGHLYRVRIIFPWNIPVTEAWMHPSSFAGMGFGHQNRHLYLG